MIKRLLLLTIFSFTLTSLAFGQLFEDFEQNQKLGYAAGTVEQSSGIWFLDDALIRSDGNGDLKNGNQSVRIRNGFLQMNFDFPDGATTFQFLAGNSSFSGDGGGILQAYISTDSGNSWSEIGDELVMTDDLELYEILVEESGSVRFRVNKVDGGRINIDDVYIEPFIELQDTPTVVLRRGNDNVENNAPIQFPATGTGTTRTVELQVSNNGEPDLEITEASLQNGEAFVIGSDITGTLASRESVTLSISFTPQTVDSFEDQLTISTNDPETPEFTLNLSGSALSEDDISTIADARELEFGTRVTVAGRVTVANEFEGPSFIQDETAGIAVFYGPMHAAVQRGDSVVVTGPVSEFNPIGGTPRTFLRQIASFDGDTDISFEIIDTAPVIPEPKAITLADMNAGNYEAQLVTISAISFLESGVFQGGTNYDITDPTNDGELRIDQNATDLVNASIPTEIIEITGVVDRFAGTYQLKPRDSNDLEIEVFEPVGDDVPKNETFDVVTWNIEWFGNNNGPDDLDLQMNNVIEVIKTIDADLYALQEISNEQRFFALVDSLEDYSGFWANYSSQTQNTAYLYRADVIDHIDSGLLEAGQVPFDWAFRLPLFFEFNATINGITRRIHSYNVHAKALSDEESYQRRQTASLRLKVYLDANRINENVMFIGDYNDQLTTSTFNNQDSPYKNFVDDDHYYTITQSLEERGFASYIAGQFRSMIDHITVTNELVDDHINGAERVENPNYIGSFISTTSDHAPVWTRFDFSRSLVSTEDEYISESPETFELNQNYPNPFNPTTNISFSVPERSDVTLKVYDVMGREVASIANSQTFTRGAHTLAFDASSLSSGMYIYRLTLDNGMSLSRKMMIVK